MPHKASQPALLDFYLAQTTGFCSVRSLVCYNDERKIENNFSTVTHWPGEAMMSTWLDSVKTSLKDLVQPSDEGFTVPKWVLYPALATGAVLGGAALVWYTKPSYVIRALMG